MIIQYAENSLFQKYFFHQQKLLRSANRASIIIMILIVTYLYHHLFQKINFSYQIKYVDGPFELQQNND